MIYPRYGEGIGIFPTRRSATFGTPSLSALALLFGGAPGRGSSFCLAFSFQRRFFIGIPQGSAGVGLPPVSPLRAGRGPQGGGTSFCRRCASAAVPNPARGGGCRRPPSPKPNQRNRRSTSAFQVTFNSRFSKRNLRNSVGTCPQDRDLPPTKFPKFPKYVTIRVTFSPPPPGETHPQKPKHQYHNLALTIVTATGTFLTVILVGEGHLWTGGGERFVFAQSKPQIPENP